MRGSKRSQALPCCLMKTRGALLSVPGEDWVQLVQDTDSTDSGRLESNCATSAVTDNLGTSHRY